MPLERVVNDVKKKIVNCQLAVEAEGVDGLTHGPFPTDAKEHASSLQRWTLLGRLGSRRAPSW